MGKLLRSQKTLPPTDITAQILAAVQNTIQSQNSALLQEVHIINQCLNSLQDSHDAAVASLLDSAATAGNNLPSMDNLHNTYPAPTPYQPAAPYQPTVLTALYQPTVPAGPSQSTVCYGLDQIRHVIKRSPFLHAINTIKYN